MTMNRNRSQLEEANANFDLPYSGLKPNKVYRNLPAAALYELVSLGLDLQCKLHHGNCCENKNARAFARAS